MRLADMSAAWHRVALRKESVDRNSENPMISVDEIVALRKESVDRNFDFQIHVPPNTVALRKESVDRNHFGNTGIGDDNGRSPQGERG